MQSLRYALVAYVKSQAGEFAERLGRELHPPSVHLAAHLTLLPPRTLPGSESSALHWIEEVCGQSTSFQVALGDVETFLPTTPTVYIRVAQSASLMCDLHRRLNADALAFQEEWPYVPHLTLAKLDCESDALAAATLARQRWAQFTGSRIVSLDQLTFVREDSPNCWSDLAPIPLGPSLVSR
jgi:2'-5' RNA ligase